MSNWIYTIGPGYYYNHESLYSNAVNVKDYLDAQGGFTEAAIIGIIANMEHESYLNPGQQEHGKGGSDQYGYGLVQWTPASSKIVAYANAQGGNWYDGDLQMDYLMINAPASWQESSSYRISWEEYKQITDIYEATRVFFYNFERGTWHSDLDNYAYYWDNQLYGVTPPPVPPSPPPGPQPPEEDEFLLMGGLYLSKMIQ